MTQSIYIADNESKIKETADDKVTDCRCNGIALYGKVRIVNSFPDFTIQFVDSFPDFSIKMVESFPGMP